MSYAIQSFQSGQVLTAAQTNQLEENIRAHYHGRANVVSIFESTLSNSDSTLAQNDAGRALFVTTTRSITLAANSISAGWYAGVFNISSLTHHVVALVPSSGSTIDGLPSIPLGPGQGVMVIAGNDGGGIDFSTIGRDKIIPQVAKNVSYTLALADGGSHLYHDIASAHGYTIPGNATVGFPIGTAITFVNANSAGNLYIINSDTMRRVGTTDTGTRTVAANGMATALKVSSATWFINGNGLT